MENKLSRDEVLHVAHLARIGISEEEIERYQVTLKKMIDEIDKIKDLDDFDQEMIFSPHDDLLPLEEINSSVCCDNLLKNVPHTKGNFIEVPVMINE